MKDEATIKPWLFHGWYIVGCGLIAHSMRVGLGLQTFGFFVVPMSAELGWNRTTITSGLMVQGLVGAAITPAIGFALDKYGPRWLMAGSAICMGLSLMLLSQTHNLWQFVLSLGIIGALGLPGLSYTVITPTLAK